MSLIGSLPIGGFLRARKSQSTVLERRGERSGEPQAHDEGEAEDLPCAWWRRRSRTTLTRATIRKPAAGRCWKNSSEASVGSKGRGDLEGAATIGSPSARPWFARIGRKKGPKPQPLHEACKAEGEVAATERIMLGSSEDDVVGDLDSDDAPGFTQLARDADIGARRLGVPGYTAYGISGVMPYSVLCRM